MATDQLRKMERAKIRQWRITVKSDDGITLRYEEPFQGNEVEAFKRARLMWARTSFVVNKRELNRDVYALLEVMDEDTMKYRTVKEKRGRLPKNAAAPSGS